MPESAKSPLTRLVLFMICLAIAGSFVAGVHYFAVDLPQQKVPEAPANGMITTGECRIHLVYCQATCDSTRRAGCIESCMKGNDCWE